MRIIPFITRYAALAVGAVLLAGCPSMGPGRLPPSLDHAEATAQRGDHAAAAREFEALAAENPGSSGLNYSLRAAREYLAAQRPDDAQRIVDSVPTSAASGPAAFELTLLRAELALAHSQSQAAWTAVASLATPADTALAIRLLELRQRAAFATARPIDAISAEMTRERLLSSDAARAASRRQLLAGLRAAVERGAKLEPQNAREPMLRGWLELGLLAAQNERGNVSTGLAAWRARYPTHPGIELARTGLNTAEPNATVVSTPTGTPSTAIPAGAHVAVLLPISGRAANAAAQIRDGLVTALYALPAGARPSLRIYDTSTMSVADAIARATDAGAERIVGPLTREEVVAAAEYTGARPPILALNFLPVEKQAPADFYQFALSPEDEARQVARRALADGRRRAIVLTPSGDWGTRVATAFRDELTAGGGQVLAASTFSAGANDFSGPIQQSLRISDSNARKRRIESVLGTTLQFNPRRRGDVDFIFSPAPSATARMLRPQLRFHFAGDIPAYSTSDAYEPNPQANQDLDGLIFPDMPWVLGGNATVTRVRGNAQNAWGEVPRGKLYAFGYDAWQLAAALRAGTASSAAAPITGLTGDLSFDEQRRVKRELNWAQIRGGNARLLSRGDAE